jgi:steroid delta-isomerase-like uncharacterized protein
MDTKKRLGGSPMSVEQNKALVKRFFEAVNQVRGDTARLPSLIRDFIAPEHVTHSLQGDTNLEQTAQMWAMLFVAFPDMNEKIADIFAEGDKVVTRQDVTGTHRGSFQGMPPSGRQFRFVEASIFRVAGDKIVEEWSFPDLLGLMQQLGAIPSPPPR